MWFNVVSTRIDNDTRHHSGQNVESATNFFFIDFLKTSTADRIMNYLFQK